mgnify:CR=1 FL=1
MLIGGKEYEQIVITTEKTGRLVTADDNKEVIAIISDDEQVIVKNGYNVKMVAASKRD